MALTSRSYRVISWCGALALVAGACTSSGSPATTTGPPVTTAPASPPTATEPPATTSGATGPPTATTVAPTTTTTTVDPDYAWVVGDCFDFGTERTLDALPYAPYGTAGIVGCGQAHTHEVFFVGQVDDGPDDPFPGEALSRLVSTTCAGAFRDFAGLLRAESKLDVVQYLPDEEEWGEGLRYLACVVLVPGPGGSVRAAVGSLEGVGEAARWPADVGACFDGTLGEIVNADAVDCDRRHTAEIVGVAVHPAEAGDPHPGPEDLSDFVNTECGEALADFAEGAVADPSISVGVLPFAEADWDLGYRALPCVAFATNEIGQLFQVQGSFRDDWVPLGVFGEGGLSA